VGGGFGGDTQQVAVIGSQSLDGSDWTAEFCCINTLHAPVDMQSPPVSFLQSMIAANTAEGVKRSHKPIIEAKKMPATKTKFLFSKDEAVERKNNLSM